MMKSLCSSTVCCVARRESPWGWLLQSALVHVITTWSWGPQEWGLTVQHSLWKHHLLYTKEMRSWECSLLTWELSALSFSEQWSSIFWNICHPFKDRMKVEQFPIPTNFFNTRTLWQHEKSARMLKTVLCNVLILSQGPFLKFCF